MPSATASPTLRPRLAPLPMARWAGWFVLLASLALIGASLGSYLYHRRQLESIAARHQRFVVVGPNELRAGVPCDFSLLTTQVTGAPTSVPVEWSLSTADGRRLLDRKEATDDNGRLAMVVPANMLLPTKGNAAAALNVTVAGGEKAVSTVLPLAVRQPRLITRVQTDRESYRPGDTVYYRSLTAFRYGLAADGTLPLEFEILDPKEAALPGSQAIGLTERGVGNGSYRLPVSLEPGKYVLVVRGADDAVPEERCAFEVKGLTAASAPAEAPAANNAGSKKDEKKAVHVDFFPEGGALVAGVVNRVYFAARDAQDRPVEIRGEVVDSQGEKIAKLQSAGAGRGRFDFAPAATQSYRVQIVEPGGIADATLPPAAPENKVAIVAERGVIAPGAAIELSLRSAKDDLPLVVAARVGGTLIGERMVIASADAAGHPVTLPLDERVAGLIDVGVYDCQKSPPRLVAARLFFRQPRRLTVAAERSKPSEAMRLSVRDDKGQPVPAALSVMAFARAKADAARDGRPRADLLRAMLAGDGVTRATELAEYVLQHDRAEGAAQSLELALGCRGPHAPPADKSKSAVEGDAPVIFDNVVELRGQYEATLSEYRAKRTQVINALVMLSFFGGLGLALLVTMLALLRIVSGSQLWLPTVGATLCCVVVTAVSNDPSRMKPVEVAAVGFASYAARPTAAPDAAAAPASAADGPLQRLAQKLAGLEGETEAEALKADRFPVAQYAPAKASEGASSDERGQPAAWFPLLIADREGRVTLPGVTASAAKSLRLDVEAHDGGQLESCELQP